MDLENINRNFDLLNLVSGLTDLKHSGAWWSGPCPFCGGRDRFSLKQEPGGWRWFCRRCGDGKYHTVVDFAQRLYPGEALPAAVQRMTGDNPCVRSEVKQRVSITKPAHVAIADGLRDSWENIIDFGQEMLWSPVGCKAREYLLSRGFKEITLKSVWHRIGWSDGRKIDGCWVDRGILLPCFEVRQDLSIGHIPYIKIRRLPDQEWKYKPERTEKYRKLAGGTQGLYNINWVDADIIFFTEGEFDTLMLFQEAKDLVGACTIGSASERIDLGKWGIHFLPVEHIITVYDNDQAGISGAQAWLSLGNRVKHTQPPEPFKDINEFFMAGGDVGCWVMTILKKMGIN